MILYNKQILSSLLACFLFLLIGFSVFAMEDRDYQSFANQEYTKQIQDEQFQALLNQDVSELAMQKLINSLEEYPIDLQGFEAFIDTENINQPMIDSLEKNYCDICKIFFEKKAYFNRHIREVHSAKRPYECQTCGMYFKSNRNLRTHINDKHELSQFYICSICHRSFTQKGNYKRHFNKYRNIPYSCRKCGRHFEIEKQLKKHRKRHGQCHFCKRFFSNRQLLEAHCLKVHNKNHAQSKETYSKEDEKYDS